jgi:hypothetical protein
MQNMHLPRRGLAAQVYYVYGFMLLVFLILAIVTVCVTIVGTYFLLNAENYHWQWTSFCAAASTALCAAPTPPCNSFDSLGLRAARGPLTQLVWSPWGCREAP